MAALLRTSPRIGTPTDSDHSLHEVPQGNLPRTRKIAPTRTLESHELTLCYHPIYTIKYFVLAVYDAVPKKWPFSVQSTAIMLTAITSTLCLHNYGKNGSSRELQSLCHQIEASVLETLFWIGCGVLSTIGLGSGVQTGALFLFPHVCRMALAWSKEQQQEDMSSVPSLAALLWSVAIPGFWSGGGSAAGELVPFLLARVLRQSGKDPFDLLHVELPSAAILYHRDGSSSTASTLGSQDSLSSNDSMSDQESVEESLERSQSLWTPALLLSNTRSAMESQLSSNAFWKIFTLAVVPNALFDLAGLVCGASSDVTWWQFFSATWLAKALVRTPGQTCGLALAVVAIASPSSLASAGRIESQTPQELTRAAAAASSSATNGISDFFERWGRLALAEFVGDEEFVSEKDFAGDVPTQNSDPSLAFVAFKAMWSAMTVIMLAFFIVSTVEQVAQHYFRSQRVDLLACGKGDAHPMKKKCVKKIKQG